MRMMFNRLFDTDAQRRSFASLRSFQPGNSDVSPMKLHSTVLSVMLAAACTSAASFVKPGYSVDVRFSEGSFALETRSQAALDSLVKWANDLRKCPAVVTVRGVLGDEDLRHSGRVRLVAQRAAAVRDYLDRAGISTVRAGTGLLLVQRSEPQFRSKIEVEATAFLRSQDGTCY